MNRISQLAELLGCENDRVLEIMEARDQLQSVLSLDNQLVEQEYEQNQLQGSPENGLDHLVMVGALKQLEERERQVILMRYYRDMTQQQIAKRLGVSQVQISRIEKKALLKLREKMEDLA